MQTIRLYEKDGLCFLFSATVTDVCEHNGKIAAVLDRTAFFPEGGGQPADEGTLGNVHVFDVREENGIIYHYLEKTPVFQPGDTVNGAVDADMRFPRMQAHTGEHLVSGLAHSLYGAENVGFHMDGVVMTVDFDRYLDKDQLAAVEKEANACIWKDLSVTACNLSEEGDHPLPYRSKLDSIKDPRIVTISGVDRCACCAPHLPSTGRIGLIKILSSIRHRGGVRLTLICGQTAYFDYIQKYDQITVICEALALKQYEAADTVLKLIEKDKEYKHLVSVQNDRLIAAVADTVPYSDKNYVLFLDGYDTDELRKLSCICKEKCEGVFIALSGDEHSGYRFSMSAKNGDLRSHLGIFKNALQAGGGGQANLIQGLMRASKSEILSFFEAYQL